MKIPSILSGRAFTDALFHPLSICLEGVHTYLVIMTAFIIFGTSLYIYH